jgi:hypothetical protein
LGGAIADSDGDEGTATPGLAMEDKRAQSMAKSGEGGEQKATADPRRARSSVENTLDRWYS